MKKAPFLTFALTTMAAGAAGLAGAAAAWADDADPAVQPLGQQGEISSWGGVQGWTVGGLQPSADAIPYQPGGTLWEATATEQAIAGGAIPIIPAFSARTAGGEDYRALFQVPTALGVNPSGLAQGQSTTGKLYFDVTGANPDSVVYSDGGQDQLTWVQPPPSAEGGPAAGYSTTAPWSGSGSPSYGGQAATTMPQTGTGTGASTGTAAPAATTPAQGATPAAPTKPATAAAAADDVHGAATAAQPKSTATQLDVHDTTAPATPAPAAQGTAAAPAASAPTASAPAAGAPAASAPATAAAPAPAAAATPAAAPAAAPVIPTKAPAASS